MPAKRKRKIKLPHLNRVMEFRDSLNPETDRGCAIAAAAFLDEELKVLLTGYLADDSKILHEVFSGSGPLATFSARVDLALLMGLLSRSAWRDLHIIRKIRNDFAHYPQPLSFEDGAIMSRCSELYHSLRKSGATPRQHFTSAVCAVLATIHGSLFHAKRPVVPRDILLTKEFKTSVLDNAEKIVDDLRHSLEDEPAA